MRVTDQHPEVRRILRALVEDVQAGVPILLERRERYGAILGDFRVQFEGEDDLLHLAITRVDGGRVSHEDAQHIADLFFHAVPKGLIYSRPAEYSVHYYVAHDLLLRYLIEPAEADRPNRES